MVNYNIKPSEGWERFSGADNRLIYPSSYKYYDKVTSACVLTNTSRGYGYTANVTVNAEPIKNMNVMMAYTHTESKEVTGLPGNNANSTWQGQYTIDGPNFATVQRSQYVVPDRVIASVNYTASHCKPGFETHYSLFYSGYSPSGYSFLYTNDMNGDGINNDLMYIPKDDSEIQFANEADRADFWAFVNQDSYLKNHKEAKVNILGYASPEGSAEVNERIANQRAEAVKNMLVNKYRIDARRITAKGQGVGRKDNQ